MNLAGKTILVTGGARRIGRTISLAAAGEGANVIIHHNRSQPDAEKVAEEIHSMGSQAWILQADLEDPTQVTGLLDRIHGITRVDALINNAAIFAPGNALTTTLDNWQQHLAINLTAPFLLSQAFARQRLPDHEGRIINILDWRALRPGFDHFAYTISKGALATMTQSLALAFAPQIVVNGLAFGAILPPADGGNTDKIIQPVPAKRWADLDEVAKMVVFLLTSPTYMTGEIIHLDGGRHLV
jgi:NAD(P)-dependent dehydrogenase (short-subunit alcohol dehydrogenase family)